ncbi:MAG: hypothetical protein WB626_01090 [Bacteroidota bacterium]
MEQAPAQFQPVERPKFDDSVAQLIRSAERFISLRKFHYAKDQLSLARTLDPRNSYIEAILQRVEALELRVAQDPARYLAVTVGPEFNDGIRGKGDQASPLAPKELQARVRQLTSVAETFLDQESFDSAFDMLMKAYLLDPASPYVLMAERTVIPAWFTHHRWSIPVPDDYRQYLSEERREITMQQATEPQGKGGGVRVPDAETAAEQESRLQALKLQKEMERRVREQEMWRKASEPPRVYGPPEAPAEQPPPEKQAGDRGLFARLKLGKFLDP